MDYGKIYITTKTWQTGTDVLNYVDGTVYFQLFGERCKCNLQERVVYHEVLGEWQVYESVKDIIDVRTPEILIEKGK